MRYEEADDCDCGGIHPPAAKRFRALDLEKTRADDPIPVSLTDLFSESDASPRRFRIRWPDPFRAVPQPNPVMTDTAKLFKDPQTGVTFSTAKR